MLDWPDYVDLLKGSEALLDRVGGPRDDATRARLFQQFAAHIAQGYFLLFQSTPEHPEFAPFENSVFLTQPNPDGVYYYAPIDWRGTYRVSGERGTAPVAGFALGSRMIGMDPAPGKGLGNYDMDQLTINADGRFEVIFSAERPDGYTGGHTAGYTGDWRPIRPETDFLMVRQFSEDWGIEQDVRLAIERLDVPPLRPALTAAEIDAKLRHLFGGYVRNLSGIAIGAVNRCAAGGFVNRFNLNDYQNMGNTQDWPQAYWEMVFDLADDEALIIDSELPAERAYWNVQVIDALWNQVDYVYRQSSLNGRQAMVDSDGHFRAVLAHRDPGVANWLDTGGNLYGMLIGRWYRCSSHPLPQAKKVKFAELGQHLPADIARVTPEERAEALRRRSVGAQMRRKW